MEHHICLIMSYLSFCLDFFFILKHRWTPSSVHVAANDRISFYGQILFTQGCASHFSLHSSFPHRQLLPFSSVINSAQTSLQHFQHWLLFPFECISWNSIALSSSTFVFNFLRSFHAVFQNGHPNVHFSSTMQGLPSPSAHTTFLWCFNRSYFI